MPISRVLPVLLSFVAGSAWAQTTVPTATKTFPAQTFAPGGAAVSLNLADYFGLPTVSRQIVQFDTVLGKFNVEMRSDAAPQTVANFLGYVQRGDYANSMIHRSAVLDASGAIGIIQGGGYYLRSDGVASIVSQSPVPLEYNLPNERGTLAAARGSDVNSATSQWYFNVRDNSTILDTSNGGGYAVFGRVLGTGMTVVDAIAALQRVDAGAPFNELPVRNYTSGTLQASNLVLVNSINVVSLYPTGSGTSALNFSVQSSAPAVVAATLSGSTLTLTPGSAGSATVTVTAADVNGNTVQSAIAVTVVLAVPSITVQPRSQTIATGNTVVLSAVATGAATFQWQRNGSDLAGATNATLVISNASAANAGNYVLVARNQAGSATSSAATLNVVDVAPTDVGRLINLSIRSTAGSGDQTLSAGFSIDGSGTLPLLIRGIGPSLAQYNVSGVLADPVLTMYQSNTPLVSNNDWANDPTIDAWSRQVNAFGLAPTALDAALAVTPAPGTYSVQVTANGSGTGVALVELYDATASGVFANGSPKLINVSARTQVGTGDNVLIAGFTIGGSTSRSLLIRGVGPALIPYGVSTPLGNPKLQIVKQGTNTVLAENDDWAGDPQVAAAASAVQAFPLVDASSKDAALLVTLPPGSYSAIVSGSDGGTGVALVEVYEVK